jgi:hypothetical protein
MRTRIKARLKQEGRLTAALSDPPTIAPGHSANSNRRSKSGD